VSQSGFALGGREKVTPHQKFPQQVHNPPHNKHNRDTMPKIPRPAQANDRHNPLAEEYSATNTFKTKAPKKRNRKSEEDEDNVIDTKASRKILKIGQELADEEEEERKSKFPQPFTNSAFAFETRFPNDVESEEETGKWDDDNEEAWGEEEEVFEVEV